MQVQMQMQVQVQTQMQVQVLSNGKPLHPLFRIPH